MNRKLMQDGVLRPRSGVRTQADHWPDRLAGLFLQDDMSVANGPGATVRTDMNNQFQSLATMNSGAAAPSTTFGNLLWADTTNTLAKKRNNANAAWKTFADLDFTHWLLDDGTAGAPAYSFNAGTAMGMYRVGTNILGFSTAGVERYRIDASGNHMFNTTDADANIGSSSLSALEFSLKKGNGVRVSIGADSNYWNLAAATGSLHSFRFQGTACGSIVVNTGSTSYVTTSDKDLKNDLGVATSTDVLSQTVIHDFTWKQDGRVDRGVFAQDAKSIKPSAIVAGDDTVDAKGNKLNPWGADYSKYVPDLIVGWQHHQAAIASLRSQLIAVGIDIE